MAFTQIMKEGGESESTVENLLKEEYKLLCTGDSIKAQFDRWAVQCEIAVPSEKYVTPPLL
jgi:hypothetical protein